jgi:hypothetical protein
LTDSPRQSETDKCQHPRANGPRKPPLPTGEERQQRGDEKQPTEDSCPKWSRSESENIGKTKSKPTVGGNSNQRIPTVKESETPRQVQNQRNCRTTNTDQQDSTTSSELACNPTTNSKRN